MSVKKMSHSVSHTFSIESKCLGLYFKAKYIIYFCEIYFDG